MAELKITKDNFEAEVTKSDRPVLVDFWASWCGPCRMLSPVIEQIAAENESFKVGKVNVDEEPELASLFHVASIPTLIVFKDGNAVSSSAGVKSKDSILAMLK